MAPPSPPDGPGPPAAQAPVPPPEPDEFRTGTRQSFLRTCMFVGDSGGALVRELQSLSFNVSRAMAYGTRVLELGLRMALQSPEGLAALRAAVAPDSKGNVDDSFWQRAPRHCMSGVTRGGLESKNDKPVPFVVAALQVWYDSGGQIVEEYINGGGLEQILTYEAKHYQQTLLKNYTVVALRPHCANFIRTMAREKHGLRSAKDINPIVHLLDHWYKKPIAVAEKRDPDQPADAKRPRVVRVSPAERLKMLADSMPEVHWVINRFRELAAEKTTAAAMVSRTLETMEFRHKMNTILATLKPREFTKKDGEKRTWTPPQFQLVPWARKPRRCLTIDVKIMKGIWRRVGLGPLPRAAKKKPVPPTPEQQAEAELVKMEEERKAEAARLKRARTEAKEDKNATTDELKAALAVKRAEQARQMAAQSAKRAAAAEKKKATAAKKVEAEEKRVETARKKREEEDRAATEEQRAELARARTEAEMERAEKENESRLVLGDFFTSQKCRLFRRQRKAGSPIPPTMETDGFRVSFPFQVRGAAVPLADLDTPVKLEKPEEFWSKSAGLFVLKSVPACTVLPDPEPRVIGIDPGEVNVLTTSDGVKFTGAEYGSVNKSRAAKLEKLKKKPSLAPVREAELHMATVSFLTRNLAELVAAIPSWCDAYNVVQWFYGRPKVCRASFVREGLAHKLSHKVVKLVAERPTDILAFGQGYNGRQAKRHDPYTPVAKRMRRLLVRWRRVVLIDEYYTSQKCCVCHTQLVDREKSREKVCHGPCAQDVDRDHNAARNILAVFQAWTATGERPEYLARPAAHTPLFASA